MGTNNPQKRGNKKYTNIQFLIENSVMLAIGLCFLGIITTVLLQVFYEPTWKKDIVNDVKEHLDSKNVGNLLILYGGGTVQYYLNDKGINVPTSNRIIIPAPSGVARASLKDDVFFEHLRDKVIIMSSKRADEKDFETNSAKMSGYKVLEIFLDIDTLYIRTTNSSIKEKYKDKILVSELKQLLFGINKGELSLKAYITSKNSGTWDTYSELTNKLIDSMITKEYTINSDFVNNDTAIVLTRTYYDPLKVGGAYTPIYILKDEDSKPYISKLFLYIPVTLDKDYRVIIPSHTLEFLKEVKPKKDFSNIIGTKTASIIKDPDAER